MIDWNIGEVEYRNQKNYNTRPVDGRTETPSGVSQTIPGEALSIKEIMDRAIAGMRPIVTEQNFIDVDDIDQITEMFAPQNVDFTDLQDLREKNVELKRIIDAAIKAKEDAPLTPEPEPEPTPDPPTP